MLDSKLNCPSLSLYHPTFDIRLDISRLTIYGLRDVSFSESQWLIGSEINPMDCFICQNVSKQVVSHNNFDPRRTLGVLRGV